MELGEIEAFLTIHRVGSFTRGAELLHISQPAISRRIDLLERELGVPLFERLTTGIRLTEAGVAFLPYAQRVLSSVEDGRSAVRGIGGEERTTITLALTGTLASTRLTSSLHAFRLRHPGVRLLLRTGRSDEVSALVRQGDALIGLRYFEDPHPEIASLKSAVERVAVVSAMDSALVPPNPSQPQDLAGIPWVTYPIAHGSSGEPFARALEQQLLRTGLDSAERIVIDSLTAQKRFIEADFGLGLLPLSSVAEELRLGTLKILDIPELMTEVPVMAIHRRHGYLGGASRLLLDMLTELEPLS